jgi:predicted nuclease of predicted toxin-antitoxin system
MKVLLDSCVWVGATGDLQAAGHDVNAVRTWGSDPGDEEILRRSIEEDRILVTLDKDFGELIFVLGYPHRGIVRLVDIRARDQGRVLANVLARFRSELENHALVVVEPDRVRLRMPPK